MSPRCLFSCFVQTCGRAGCGRLLPQLALWPESHIISTHFTNHDMANMRRSKPHDDRCQLKRLVSLPCANKVWELTTTQCPFSAIIHEEKSIWKPMKMLSPHMKSQHLCQGHRASRGSGDGDTGAREWGRALLLPQFFHLLAYLLF